MTTTIEQFHLRCGTDSGAVRQYAATYRGQWLERVALFDEDEKGFLLQSLNAGSQRFPATERVGAIAAFEATRASAMARREAAREAAFQLVG